MQIERDEDTFDAIKTMAENIDLASRNYNDELIAIDYYKNLDTLTKQQLKELEKLWQIKCRICYKEMLASRWMIVQVLLLISTAIYIAWISGGHYPVIIASILGTIAMIAMLEDKRASIAKRNWLDANKVLHHLKTHLSKRSDKKLK